MAMKLEDILNALPSKEELGQYLNREVRNNTTATGGEIGVAFGIFGAGLLLGAGLALLFAPKAGSELRQDLASRMSHAGEHYGGNGHDQPHQTA